MAVGEVGRVHQRQGADDCGSDGTHRGGTRYAPGSEARSREPSEMPILCTPTPPGWGSRHRSGTRRPLLRPCPVLCRRRLRSRGPATGQRPAADTGHEQGRHPVCSQQVHRGQTALLTVRRVHQDAHAPDLTVLHLDDGETVTPAEVRGTARAKPALTVLGTARTNEGLPAPLLCIFGLLCFLLFRSSCSRRLVSAPAEFKHDLVALALLGPE